MNQLYLLLTLSIVPGNSILFKLKEKTTGQKGNDGTKDF